MGRQIQLSMLPADAQELVFAIPDHGLVEVATQRGRSASVEPLAAVPNDPKGNLILWNKRFAVGLQRRFVPSSDAPYYTLDVWTEPILEFSTSLLTEWQGRPALTQGRIYGVFDDKPIEFEKWYERVVRFIRKRWRKNPAARIGGGYVGPAASAWFESGGLLLPGFVPPVTNDWIRVLGEQHPLSG